MEEIELPNPEELEEIKAHAFTRRVALTTAIFAVLLAFSSLGGSNAMKEMILAQQQASDQWAYYQAKAAREHFYRGQKMRLELDLLEKETLKPEIRQRYDACSRRWPPRKSATARSARKSRKKPANWNTNGTSPAAKTRILTSPRSCCRLPS